MRCVFLDEAHDICGIQTDVHDVRVFEQRCAADGIDGAEGKCVEQGVFVTVKADDGVLCIFFEGLCERTADETQTNDCDLHIVLPFG